METFLVFLKYVGTFLFVALAAKFVAGALNEGLSEEEFHKIKKANYKNIAIMAANLVKCSPSSRKKILIELYDDDEWTKEEVNELKSVLEGMLKTKIFLDDDGLKSI